MATKTILVASASANTGSKVVEQLSASGQVNIKALVRNPDGESAKALAALPRVTVVKGDFTDAASLDAALQGVDRAFLVSAAGEHEQYDREVAFIAAADKAGIEVTVRISTANILISLESTGVYARAHARIEKYIEEHKSRVIDLRPDWFISNIFWQAAEIKATRKLTYPISAELAANSKFAAVDTRDVAGAAAAILLAPKETVDKLLQIRGLEIHGPELISFADQLAAISEVTGKPVELQSLDPDAWAKMLVSFGTSELMATSFRDTVLKAVGAVPTPRPYTPETTPELAAIYKPKHTFKAWAKENAAAFA